MANFSDKKMKPGLRSQARTERAGSRQGQAMLEFAMVAPVLLMVVTGIVSFGIVVQNSLVLTNAVNTGAQLLAASRGQTTDPCATATAAIEAAAPNLASGSLSFTFVINGSTYTSTSCASGASGMTQGASAEVEATYPCLFKIFKAVMPACTLTGQTTEIIQ